MGKWHRYVRNTIIDVFLGSRTGAVSAFVDAMCAALTAAEVITAAKLLQPTDMVRLRLCVCRFRDCRVWVLTSIRRSNWFAVS